MEDLVLLVLKGVGIGAFTALVGYLKALPDGETFDYLKAVPALVIGALVGAVQFGMNLDVNGAEALIASFGAVSLVNSLWALFLKQHAKVSVAAAKKTIVVKK